MSQVLQEVRSANQEYAACLWCQRQFARASQSSLSFVPFTARQANNALVGSCLSSIACLIRLMRDADRTAAIEWV